VGASLKVLLQNLKMLHGVLLSSFFWLQYVAIRPISSDWFIVPAGFLWSPTQPQGQASRLSLCAKQLEVRLF
jgi:hypothetical protein